MAEFKPYNCAIKVWNLDRYMLASFSLEDLTNRRYEQLDRIEGLSFEDNLRAHLEDYTQGTEWDLLAAAPIGHNHGQSLIGYVYTIRIKGPKKHG